MKVLIAGGSWLLGNQVTPLLSFVDRIDLIIQSRNLKEAAEFVVQFRPDIILLECPLPGGNVLDLMHTLKSGRYEPFVVILSDFTYPDFKTKCLAEGVDYFFEGAFGPSDMSPYLNDYKNALATWHAAAH